MTQDQKFLAMLKIEPGEANEFSRFDLRLDDMLAALAPEPVDVILDPQAELHARLAVAERQLAESDQRYADLLDRYSRIEQECAGAYREAKWQKRQADRSHQAFLLATIIAAVMTLLAIAGWL